MSPPEGGTGSGPIRRFPAGFWASFNQWWHSEYSKAGHRPSSKNIAKWHAENSLKCWGEHAVSYAETQRHANRMKCRRANQAASGGERGRQAWNSDAEGETEEEDLSECDDDDMPRRKRSAPAEQHSVGVDLNASSDLPGALVAHLHAFNADSDIPEPAAPYSTSRNSKRRLLARTSSRALPPIKGGMDEQPSFYQPDPTGPTCRGPGETHSSHFDGWDSSVTVADPEGPACNNSQATAALPLLPARYGGNRKQRGRADVSTSGEEVGMRLGPLGNPFADMAAAAGGGLPTPASLPAARDAAALLARTATVPSDAASLQPQPSMLSCNAWLHGPVSCELDGLLQDMGIAAGLGMQPAMPPPRPRALASREPLALPEARPWRNLDALLLRPASGSVGGVAGAPRPSSGGLPLDMASPMDTPALAAESTGMVAPPESIEQHSVHTQQLLQQQQQVMQPEQGGMVVGACGGMSMEQELGLVEWPRAQHNGHTMEGLHTIDDIAIEDLL